MSAETPESTALAKLRAFIRDGLEPDERVIVAALLAPAVAQAFAADEAEVEGFSAVEWRPTLPEALAETIRESGLTITVE